MPTSQEINDIEVIEPEMFTSGRITPRRLAEVLEETRSIFLMSDIVKTDDAVLQKRCPKFFETKCEIIRMAENDFPLKKALGLLKPQRLTI